MSCGRLGWLWVRVRVRVSGQGQGWARVRARVRLDSYLRQALRDVGERLVDEYLQTVQVAMEVAMEAVMAVGKVAVMVAAVQEAVTAVEVVGEEEREVVASTSTCEGWRAEGGAR